MFQMLMCNFCIHSCLFQNNLEVALSKYEAIILKYPNSPRAHAGRAQTLDKLAEQKRSNAILEQCIEEYQKVLDLNDVPKELLLTSGQQLATRQTFRGKGYKCDVQGNLQKPRPWTKTEFLRCISHGICFSVVSHPCIFLLSHSIFLSSISCYMYISQFVLLRKWMRN